MSVACVFDEQKICFNLICLEAANMRQFDAHVWIVFSVVYWFDVCV